MKQLASLEGAVEGELVFWCCKWAELGLPTPQEDGTKSQDPQFPPPPLFWQTPGCGLCGSAGARGPGGRGKRPGAERVQNGVKDTEPDSSFRWGHRAPASEAPGGERHPGTGCGWHLPGLNHPSKASQGGGQLGGPKLVAVGGRGRSAGHQEVVLAVSPTSPKPRSHLDGRSEEHSEWEQPRVGAGCAASAARDPVRRRRSSSLLYAQGPAFQGRRQG